MVEFGKNRRFVINKYTNDVTETDIKISEKELIKSKYPKLFNVVFKNKF